VYQLEKKEKTGWGRPHSTDINIPAVVFVPGIFAQTRSGRLPFFMSSRITWKYRNFHFGDTDEHGLPGY